MEDKIVTILAALFCAAWIIVPSFFLIRWAVKKDRKIKAEREAKRKAEKEEAAKSGLHIDMDAYDNAQQDDVEDMDDSEDAPVNLSQAFRAAMGKPVGANQQISCPRCGCTQIYAGKKGFSAGKAIAGGLIAGPVGLVGGAIGQNKVVVTCLGCGHKWKV